MAYKKGNFVIKNAQGYVTLAGDATAIFNDSNNSAGFSETSPVQTHMNSLGEPTVLTRDFIEYTMELELTPGVGGTGGATPAAFANLAALQTALAFNTVGSQIITAGFDIAALNWPTGDKAVITASSIQESSDGLATLRVTAVKRTTNAGTVIDFTGAWVTTT